MPTMRNRWTLNDENKSPNSDGSGYSQEGKHHYEEHDDGNRSHSDTEEVIQAEQSDKDLRITQKSEVEYRPKNSTGTVLKFLHKNVWSPLKEGKSWWAQTLTIILAAFLTYSFHNISAGSSGDDIVTSTNVQIAIMSIITLFGATPFCSAHLVPSAIGAFVGGHNIIGSTGKLIQDHNTGMVPLINYLWLLLQSLVTGLVWYFVINHSSLKILDGFAGRLGTTTFIGMNVVMITIFGPLGVVDWNRYFYGFVHAVPLAEEDSSISLARAAWSWSDEIELAIGYVVAVVWLGVVSGANRLLHQRHIQQWERANQEELPSSTVSPRSPPPKPLNNVLIPVLWALLSMLLVNATQYKYAPGLYNGFAVGAYVAMASLQKIPSIAKFATVSLVAALWGLILTPFFVGFAGKSGFTSMLGHVTHTALERIIQRFRIQKQQQEQRQQLRMRQSRTEASNEDNYHHQQQQEQKISEQWPLQIVENDDKGGRHYEQQRPSTTSAVEQYAHSRKYIKPKETLYTKQQRRQQHRLKHLRQRQDQHPEQRPQQSMNNAVPKLHHRAWSALPEAGQEEWQHWQHPLEHEEPDEETNSGHSDNGNGIV
jgi:hypothetical protein